MPAVRKGLQALPFESVFRTKFSTESFVTGSHGTVIGQSSEESADLHQVGGELNDLDTLSPLF